MPNGRNQRGRARLLRLTAAAAILAVPALAGLQAAGAAVSGPEAKLAAAPQDHTRCTSRNGTTTCTNTYSGNTAYVPNPTFQNITRPTSQPATVTVTPSTRLVSQVLQVSWKDFTPSTSAADGVTPSTSSPSTDLYQVDIFECRGTNPQSPAGTGLQGSTDCYSYTVGNTPPSGVANGVQTFTLKDGTGRAQIFAEASQQNSFLHCSATSPCSLVIVPNWGGVEPDDDNLGRGTPFCADHSQDLAGLQHGQGDPAEIGQPCSWQDRIVVPLSFAPNPANCAGGAPAFQASGSPMLETAMLQWQFGLCAGRSPLGFQSSTTDEYSARSQFLAGSGGLGAGVDMALVTQPATAANSDFASPSARHYTYAPLANSAIAISYYLDDPVTGAQVTRLVLNARLLTKLITQSYSLGYNCSTPAAPPQKPWPAANYLCDPAVVPSVNGKPAPNPQSIYNDPEFLQLNKGNGNWADFQCQQSGCLLPGEAQGDFLPIVQAGNSDMTYELTRWVASDPAARAFKAGQPVKLGGTTMTVNKYYRGNAPGARYPADQFLPKDPGWTPKVLTGANNDVDNNVYETMQASWNPVSGIDNVVSDLGLYQPSATQTNNPVCSDGSTGFPNCLLTKHGYVLGGPWKNPPLVNEPIGQRDMTAVLDVGHAVADVFPTAALVNAAGKAVTPSTASILAAVGQMTTNPDRVTQRANYAGRNPNAYPLTMVDYAMVPTCGEPAAAASAIARFLRYVATTGQHPGINPGQLAPGYVPLTNHQRAQLLSAASAVQAQHCPGSGHASPGNTNPGSTNPGSTNPGSTNPGSTNPASTSPGGHSPGHTAGHGPATTSKLGNGNGARNASYGVNPLSAGLGRFILVILLIVGGVLVVGGPAAYLVGASGGWPAFVQRIRGLPHQAVGLIRAMVTRRA
jgi:hypothetical protein